ncbi:MAG: DNRLRE domain-containing protein [Microgenomates group bacterium]
MEGSQISKIFSLKNILIIIIVIILFVFVLFIIYNQNKSKKLTSLSITPTPEKLVVVSPSPPPTDTIAPTATITPRPTSTPKPTSTPNPTATITPSPTITPTPTPTVVITNLTLNSTATLDGWRSSNGGSNWDYPYVQAGHNATLTSRGFVSFDITSIPVTATIDSVTLRLYQVSVVGTPYTSSLIIDHVNYGTSTSATPYDGSPLSTNIGTFSENSTLEWKESVVTNSVKDDRTSSRTHAQFGLHFATESAGGADAWVQFTSANGSGNIPQLVIRYH